MVEFSWPILSSLLWVLDLMFVQFSKALQWYSDLLHICTKQQPFWGTEQHLSLCLALKLFDAILGLIPHMHHWGVYPKVYVNPKVNLELTFNRSSLPVFFLVWSIDRASFRSFDSKTGTRFTPFLHQHAIFLNCTCILISGRKTEKEKHQRDLP